MLQNLLPLDSNNGASGLGLKVNFMVRKISKFNLAIED